MIGKHKNYKYEKNMYLYIIDKNNQNKLLSTIAGKMMSEVILTVKKMIQNKETIKMILQYDSRSKRYLIADSDAPSPDRNLQGQFAWVHENIIRDGFLRGAPLFDVRG